MVYYLHERITNLNGSTENIEALYPALVENKSQCQHRIILCVNQNLVLLFVLISFSAFPLSSS